LLILTYNDANSDMRQRYLRG